MPQPPRTREEVAHLIQHRRSELGLSQAEAARRANVSPTTWIKMEAAGELSASKRRSAMVALGWSVDAYERLLAGEEPQHVAGDGGPLAPDEALSIIESALRRAGVEPYKVTLATAMVTSLLEEVPAPHER